MAKCIGIFTGSRGEWGYLRPVLERMDKINLSYKIIVTNMHLLGDKGFTYKEIENDGFKISEKIYMNINGPDDISWPKSLGLLKFQLPDIYSKLDIDLLLIAGDRAETFMAASAAYYSDIPIAHIQAGERSGHKDGMVRHAIGKLTHIHFASNSDAVNRLKRFGEQSFRVHLVGAPQIDDIKKPYLTLSKINYNLSSNIKDKFALCIVHPTSENTLDCINYVKYINAACKKNEIQQIWIYPNNDSGSIGIIKEINKIKSMDSLAFRNLNRKVYISLLSYAEFIIGNSSSGILEAPSLKTPTINLGQRQQDRVTSKSVITIAKVTKSKILASIKELKSKSMINLLKKLKNPYGDGKSAVRIVSLLNKIKLDSYLRNKFVEEDKI